VLVLGAILRDGAETGGLAAPPGEILPEALRRELVEMRDHAFAGVPEALLARGVTAWIQLFGTVSFELFGQFDNVFDDRAGFFEHQMRTMAAHIGLPPR
jgi:hypothetical protein